MYVYLKFLGFFIGTIAKILLIWKLTSESPQLMVVGYGLQLTDIYSLKYTMLYVYYI